MGMAASQARFLGLTARKSNVEYQGQQINQQRTALATESSNLFHQMMTLNVPTPPVTTEYYKTTYTLDDTAQGIHSDYTIENLTKINNGTNRYTVKLNTTETSTIGGQNNLPFTRVSRTSKNNDEYYAYTTTINGAYVNYDPKNRSALTDDTSENSKKVLSIVKGNIYLIDTATAYRLTGDEKTKNGYNAVIEKLKEDGYDKNKIEIPDSIPDDDSGLPSGKEYLYFYQDASGKNCYLTSSQLKRITEEAFSEDPSYGVSGSGDVRNISGTVYTTLYYPTTKKTDITREVNATIDSTSSGRYSSITIDENEKYPSELSGKSFSITTASAPDENAYKDAYSDYEFEKNLYEQRIAEINAKTEIIQSEDKQLELRLQQLDTEQESIKTEMDSVQKVIEDNVQKTFDAFG